MSFLLMCWVLRYYVVQDLFLHRHRIHEAVLPVNLITIHQPRSRPPLVPSGPADRFRVNEYLKGSGLSNSHIIV